jgi:hypothetical protein
LRVVLEPAGTIVLKMFDIDGTKLMNGSRSQGWISSVDLYSLSGKEFPSDKHHAHAWQPYLPKGSEEVIFLPPANVPVKLEVGLETLDFGGQHFRIDNEGKGFTVSKGAIIAINLNLEVARSTLAEVKHVLTVTTNITSSLLNRVSEVQAFVDRAIHLEKDDDVSCASASNRAILDALQVMNQMYAETPYVKSHPRLFLNREELTSLKAKTRHPQMKELWGSVVSACESYLQKPSPRQTDFDGWAFTLTAAREAITRMEYLSFAYLMTEDVRYAEKAKSILRDTLEWNWHEEGVSQALDVGELCKGTATCYDWLYNYMKSEERETVRRAIADKGARWLYGESTGGARWGEDYRYNWCAVTHGGLGVAGLAFLGEHSEAAKWVALARRQISNYLDSGGDNGGWGEGSGYWTYGTGYAVLFVEALRRVTGDDLYSHRFLRATLYFPLYCLMPSRKGSVNFADSTYREMNAQTTLMLRFASQYRNGYAQWFAETLHPWGSIGGGYGPWNFLWYDETVKATDPSSLPSSIRFLGLDWVIMRSGWGQDDILFALRSGPWWNHGHADLNSFILEAYGERLAVDLGRGAYSQDYFSTGLDYHVTSDGHNTILVDGEGQLNPTQLDESTPPATIQDFFTSSGFDYTVSDASQSYGSKLNKFLRHIVFVKPYYFVMLDDLSSGSERASYDWLVHTLASKSAISAAENSMRIAQGKANLLIAVMFPEQFSWSVTADHLTSERETATRLQISQYSQTSAMFLTILYPQQQDAVAPVIRRMAIGNIVGVKIFDQGRTDYVLFNRDKGKAEVEGIISDAQILTVSQRSEVVEAFAMHNGTRLIRGSSTLMLSSASATAAFRSTSSSLEGVIRATARCDLRFRSERPPISLTLNGSPCSAWTYDSETRLVRITFDSGTQIIRVFFEEEKQTTLPIMGLPMSQVVIVAAAVILGATTAILATRLLKSREAEEKHS